MSKMFDAMVEEEYLDCMESDSLCEMDLDDMFDFYMKGEAFKRSIEEQEFYE